MANDSKLSLGCMTGQIDTDFPSWDSIYLSPEQEECNNYNKNN